MQRVDAGNYYTEWPFKKEERRNDGEINNGGINLLLEPHRLEEIHEATDSNGLRPILRKINREGGHLMTLSCAYGLIDHAYYSYLDFTPRASEIACNTDWPDAAEAQWDRLLSSGDEKFPGIRQMLMASISMEAREISLHGSDPQWLVCTYLRARSEQDHFQLCTWLNLLLEKVESISTVEARRT